MEYFIVLFGIRYDKHWRTAKPKPLTPMPMPMPTSAMSATSNAMSTSTGNILVQAENLVIHYDISIVVNRFVLYSRLPKASIYKCEISL